MRDLGLDNSYIYIYTYIWGIFVISGKPGFIRAGFRIGFRIFLIKPGPDPDPFRVFFFKLIPDPILNRTW